MKEITKLRRRAAAVGCRVQVFRKDYRNDGQRIRYAFLTPAIEAWSGRPTWASWWASSLDELRSEVERAERQQVRP